MVADILMNDDYRQPRFYRFNEDSLKLVSFTQSLNIAQNSRFLDIGSGCGVIGIELAKLNPSWSGVLLEPQEEFIEYIKLNQKLYDTQYLKLVQSSIESADFSEKFNLIVFNPPYFFEERGRASKCQLRHSCRHINYETLSKWFEIAFNLLERGGKLIYCFRKNRPLDDIFRPLGLASSLYKEEGTVIYDCLEKLD